MVAGSTSRTPLPRECAVSMTEPATCSRSSCASSSTPVASGTRAHPAGRAGDVVGVLGGRVDGQLGLRELLGPAAAVAGAPALIGLGHPHRPQLEDAVHERLRAGRA